MPAVQEEAQQALAASEALSAANLEQQDALHEQMSAAEQRCTEIEVSCTAADCMLRTALLCCGRFHVGCTLVVATMFAM
jgi:hypothetical protein